jgi:hypothetical protein
MCASQLIRSVGRTHRMRSLLTWTGVVSLVAYGVSVLGAPPDPPPEADAVHESLIRQEFAAGCGPGVKCLVAVSGKPPRDALVRRIRDLRYVHPMPLNYAGTGVVFDMGPVTFVSSDRARVEGDVRSPAGRLGSSCTYLLRKNDGQWQVDKDQSECLAI